MEKYFLRKMIQKTNAVIILSCNHGLSGPEIEAMEDEMTAKTLVVNVRLHRACKGTFHLFCSPATHSLLLRLQTSACGVVKN